MITEKHPLVPLSYLLGAVCPWPAAPEPRLAGLTPAERTVLELLRAGCSNKEIASALGKAEPTVKHQVSAIIRKTGSRSRCQVIVRLGPAAARGPAG